MKKTIIYFLCVMMLFAFCACGKTSTNSGNTSSVSSLVESVAPEYYTDTKGNVHKISEIKYEKPIRQEAWYSITTLPEGFPMLSESVTKYSSLFASTTVEWNILDEAELKDFISKISQWAGQEMQKTVGTGSTTYKVTKIENGKKYQIDFIYQPYSDGTHIEEADQWFSQGTMYIYTSAASSNVSYQSAVSSNTSTANK